MIIGVLGKKYNGKDTFADYLVMKYGFEKFAIATPLKQIVRMIFGFSNEQLNTELKEELDVNWGVSPRNMLQYIGTDFTRMQLGEYIGKSTNNIWIDVCMRNIIGKENVVISDVRCQNEVDEIKKCGGIIIKIVRNLNNDDTHMSETGIDDIENYDISLDNNSTVDDLYKSIDEIMVKLGK